MTLRGPVTDRRKPSITCRSSVTISVPRRRRQEWVRIFTFRQTRKWGHCRFLSRIPANQASHVAAVSPFPCPGADVKFGSVFFKLPWYQPPRMAYAPTSLNSLLPSDKTKQSRHSYWDGMGINKRMSLRSIALGLLVVAGVMAQSTLSPHDRLRGEIAEGERVVLPGNVHPALAHAQSDAPVDPSFPMEHMILLLQPDSTQLAALDQLVAQQHDSHSPQYHQFLTPAQYAERFGVSQNDIDKITGWLTTQASRWRRLHLIIYPLCLAAMPFEYRLHSIRR